MSKLEYFLVGLLTGILLLSLLYYLTGQTYKQGQVDYANGIIKYELKDQPDGSRMWREKK